jgi:predicted nucleic acid-binding protein
MTSRVYLIDTNVVVAGMISARPGSPPCVIVDRMIEGALPFILSRDLLAEYRRVLLRPRIRKRHGLGPRKVDAVLTEIVTAAMMREPPDTGRRADAHVHALLKICPEAILVSGDRALSGVVEGSISPAELAERL